MKIIPLSEGSFTVDQSKAFVPFDEAADNLRERPAGSLLVEVQPFVVVTERDTILLDTGLGFSQDGELQIHRIMKENGIDPSSITKVLMSHLHKDHSGAICKPGGLGFPQATYYIQQKELEHEGHFPCLQNAPRLELLNGNGMIDDYIRYEMTSAHSRFHQVFWITEKDKIVFFGGDDAPQFHQMKSKYIAKYDFDGRKCMELRQQWWKQGTEEHWTFLFYHDIKTPFINL